ncbi:MAG: iron ABC transporter permease [Candidatus Omnitrophota bacterium]
MSKKAAAGFFWLVVILFISIITALMYGSSKIAPADIIYALTHPQIKSQIAVIIFKLRIPRIILGLLVGAGLSCCGGSFQAILRNSLAEPYTLGVASGAAFAVTLAAMLGLSAIYLPFFAFFGSLSTISLVYAIAARKRFSNPTLILGGVTLSLLLSSMVLLLFALSKQADVYHSIMWLMGDLTLSDIKLIKISAFFILPGILSLIFLGRDIDVLCLGEEKAKHLGLNVSGVKAIIFFLASLITGACIAVSGVIGFVGLIIPHIVRFAFGISHRTLLPAAGILGAAFLVFCDTLARTIVSPLELPVGVITGIFGGIFFLTLLVRSGKWEVI